MTKENDIMDTIRNRMKKKVEKIGVTATKTPKFESANKLNNPTSKCDEIT